MRWCWVLVVLLIVSCASMGTRLEQRTDNYEGYTVYEVEDNLTPKKGLLNTTEVELNPRALIYNTGEKHWLLEVEYRADDWIFIESEESLFLLIDGEVTSLSTTRSLKSSEIIYGGRIEERAVYPVSGPEFYTKIGNAGTVSIKINGDNYYIERELSDRNKEFFNRFYNHIINE